MKTQTLIPWLTGEAYNFADGEIWPEWRYHSPGMVLQRLAYALRIRSRIHARERGHVWPRLAPTMIGRARAHNILEMIRALDTERVPGAFVDCGVWRGGSTMIMANEASPNRRIYCCDTFDGFPPETAEAEGVACPAALRVPLHQVKANFRKYGVNSDCVTFLEGRVEETLHQVRGPVALARIDVDMYGPTKSALEQLAPLMSYGSRVIIDDYGEIAFDCKRAVDEFLATKREPSIIESIDRDGLWWKI